MTQFPIQGQSQASPVLFRLEQRMRLISLLETMVVPFSNQRIRWRDNMKEEDTQVQQLQQIVTSYLNDPNTVVLILHFHVLNFWNRSSCWSRQRFCFSLLVTIGTGPRAYELYKDPQKYLRHEKKYWHWSMKTKAEMWNE